MTPSTATRKKPGSASDPLWYKDAIIYEVHVKAFADSNGDGIGDFPGLMGKLDYLQSLGVTCIWLLPFFPSPLRDDGYDISDYMNVNPNYGTVADFQSFLKEAHARGMQVMIELVINHTSDQHPWFQAARKAPKGSPEREMYVWSDTDKLYSGVRIIFTDTEKSNWTWDDEAQQYYWHRFFAHQPDLNFDNPRVMEEVLKAMRFWLDMGVDGLRLDAIPYLVERDGTSCENVPETHDKIKEIRAAIDAEYDDRLILAEANMWPADVRPYFGEGDECHMAFHFPLMPRIYMALRQEDRLPITEIMAQTPPIPENCQWGLFLRNHDELTLEMVTDDERDYMYFAYSADPRMRINVGIRRRLAPLVDNNRRRIELLNSILFSFPGTPILYYGDEIGMGDNIYLGDRNGVRTPMQWNSDRNAGFSRANPQKLYSPVIMDPVWGYQAINVEAQDSDTSSLLNWTRNMIALRKLFQVFGRGTLEFLKPDNRKVLAYLREYNDERVVCVANLSRFAQPVQLDLARWEGMVPVEMLGYVPFPKIGSEPYSITLGPYSFLWLELQPAPRRNEEAEAAKNPEVMIPAETLADVLAGPGLELLQEAVLPKFVCTQRWFGSKSRTIQNASVYDWATLPDVPDAALLLVDLCYTDGTSERYVFPIALRFNERNIDARDVLVEVRRASDAASDGFVVDGLALEQVRSALLKIIRDGAAIRTQHGTMAGKPSTVAIPENEMHSERSHAEQSNSSLLFEDKFILKLFRRLQPGINPDAEIGRFLTEKGYTQVPPFAGDMVYTPADGEPQTEPTTIAILQGLVQSEGDGWEWTLRELEAIDGEDAGIARYMEAARKLAQRTAEMHAVLATGTTPEMVAEPMTAASLQADAERLIEQAESALATLRRKLADLPEDLGDLAAQLLVQRSKIREIAEQIATVDPATAGKRTRIHGDYHLGQVLRTADDFVLLDFEGEPAKPIEVRREKMSPLRDVAGMLRSFRYAAAAFARTHAGVDDWVEKWDEEVATAFLRSYNSVAAPNGPEDLLRAYLLEKALYELQYELNNRPGWAEIPLRGILKLLDEHRTEATRANHGKR
ncbi:MAG: maltose alpha-D-glucosyltransferase [Acidobacteria bacterium]|nr:maltose alpha-D-glucosyltransferase [Acidobacteriota bacterium]